MKKKYIDYTEAYTEALFAFLAYDHPAKNAFELIRDSMDEDEGWEDYENECFRAIVSFSPDGVMLAQVNYKTLIERLIKYWGWGGNDG